jgi:hypothetical protein
VLPDPDRELQRKRRGALFAVDGPARRLQGCVARVGQVHRLSVVLFFNWLHSETQAPEANTVHEPGDDGPLKARDQGLSGLFTCSW